MRTVGNRRATDRGRPRLAREVFEAVIGELQRERIIPHCRSCQLPCCTLENLVLELDWRRLRLLWGIRMARREFDARLAQARGPREVRAQGGMYYVHKRTCPAYREGECAIYDSDLKPTGCTDFPLHMEDDGSLMADLRCEALDLVVVEAALRSRLPSEWELLRKADREFPYLVRFRARRRRKGSAAARGRKSRP